MADTYGGPFGTYDNSSGVINAAGKGEVATNLINFAALLGITLTAGDGVTGAYALVSGSDSPHPDFDAIRVEQREKIGVELAAMWDAIDASSEV